MKFSCRSLLLGAWALVAVTGATQLSQEEQNFFCDFKQTCPWDGVGKRWNYFKQSWLNLEIRGPPNIDTDNFVLISGSPNETAIVSPTMKSSLAGCFTFDYYIDGPDNASLSLELISAKNETKLLWARHSRFHTRGKNDNWRQGYIQVSELAAYQLKFTAVSLGGSIALNNFRYSHGEDVCPIRSKAECDFEAGHTCGWHLEKNSENPAATFSVIEAGKLNYLDHTSYSVRGKVLALEWKNAKKLEELEDVHEQIVSPSFPKGDPAKCFTFAMRRAENFTVKVKQFSLDSRNSWKKNSIDIWTSDSDLENNLEWVKVRVSINAGHELSQMVIDVAADHPNASGVSMFDDLKLENEPCAAPVDCKFGDDICGWVYPLPYNTWSLGSGRLANLSRVDTTKNSYPIHFKKSLYSDYTSANLDKFSMLIESDKIFSREAHCAHLQFAVDNFGEHEIFQFAQLTQRENHILWRFEQEHLPQGVVHNVQIQVPELEYYEPRRFSLSALSWEAQTRISIQEIKLLRGTCPPVTKTPSTLAPTTEAPFVASKLDRTKLILVEQMLKNARSDVQRASELITIRDDPVYVATEKVLANIDASIREIEKNLK